MKKYKNFSLFILGFSVMFLLFVLLSHKSAQSLGGTTFLTYQGGTGTSSPSGILYGDNTASSLKTVTIGSNLTFSGGTLSASVPSSSGAPYPFQATGNATTTLTGFIGGIISNASSTIQYLNSASSTIGTLLATTQAGIATSTPGQGALLGVNGGGFFAGTVYAPNFYDTALTGTNCVSEIGGLLGTSNCVSSIASAGSSLAVSSPTGNVDLSLNLGHQNTWSSLQSFNNGIISLASSTAQILNTDKLTMASASTTAETVSSFFQLPNSATQSPTLSGACAFDTTSGQLKCGDGIATRVMSNGYEYPSFTYATSTVWTGTTTVPLGPAYVGETWNGIQCYTDIGTVNVSIYDGTNRMNLFNASTTVGIVTLSTNNTFTAAEKRYADIGTPASSPTRVSCTVSKSLTAD